MSHAPLLDALIAKRADEAGLSVQAYRARQLAVLRDALRQLPEDDDCQACDGRGRMGRFGHIRCPECS